MDIAEYEEAADANEDILRARNLLMEELKIPAPSHAKRGTKKKQTSPYEAGDKEAVKRHCPPPTTTVVSDVEPTPLNQREARRTRLPVDRAPSPSPTFAEATRGHTPTASKPCSPRQMTPDPAAPQTQAAPTKKPKYPPMIVEKLQDWTTHFKAIKERLGRAPNARPYGQGIRFLPNEDHEYRVIQRYLTELEKKERISWFSYSLPADRSLKVAIRGLPVNTDVEEIQEELRTRGFEPEFARPIRARRGRPGCIYLVILKRTLDLTPAIYEIDELLYMPGVTIEAWRGKKGPAQCHRCQQFRHSSQNCHRTLACVRCGGEHHAKECTRPLEEPATCANCGGTHPASDFKCPVFRREARNKRAGTAPITGGVRRTKNITPAPMGIQGEAPSATLMAVANTPAPREATAPSRRRRKRGGKKKKPRPPQAADPGQRAVAEATRPPPLPAPRPQRAPKAPKQVNKSASTHPPATQARAPLPATTQPPAPRAGGLTTEGRGAVEAALIILQRVLTALLAGENTVQAVLEGMAELAAYAHAPHHHSHTPLNSGNLGA